MIALVLNSFLIITIDINWLKELTIFLKINLSTKLELIPAFNSSSVSR